MFWGKKSASARAIDEVPAAEVVASLELEGALDGTADILRALGRHSFEVGDTPAATIEETFERWATHVLVLGRAPGVVEEAPSPNGEELPRTRAWKELSRFVLRQRRSEQQHVLRTTTEMRSAITTFVGCLGRAAIEEGRSAKKLQSSVDRLKTSAASGSLDELKNDALGVVEAVTHALEEQARRMEEQTRELRDELSKLREDLNEAKSESSTDSLTQLQNRRAFDAALKSSVALSTVIARPVSLVMVDVDRFKSINDRFGHPFGDRVLRAIADCLSRCFRRRCDVVARYGGEEFACLLGETTLEEARTTTAKLLPAVRALRIEHGGQRLPISISAGVGELKRGETGEELVARVDRALYQAKARGRDRFVDAADE